MTGGWFCILLFISLVVAQNNYAPFPGVGPDDKNIYVFQHESVIGQYQVGYIICENTAFDITCLNAGSTAIQCVSNQGQQIYLGPMAYGYGSSPAICDRKLQILVYAAQSDSFSDSVTITAVNMRNFTEILYANTISTSTYQSTYLGFWVVNEETGVFYTNSGTYIQALDTATGVVKASTFNDYDPSMMLLTNNHLVTSSSVLIYGNYYGNTYYKFTVFNATTLTAKCNFNRTSLNQLNTDNEKIYVFSGYENSVGINLYSYNTNCEGIWRYPLPNYFEENPDFSYSPGFIYFFDGLNFTKVNANDPSKYKVLVLNDPLNDQLIDQHFSFMGIDNQTDIYFSSLRGDQTYYTIRKYNEDFKVALEFDYVPVLENNTKVSDYSNIVSLTNSGFLISLHLYQRNNPNFNENYLNAIQTDKGFNWQFLSIVSLVTLILTFLVAFALMLKHLLLGPDPEGWNKRKLFDLLGTLLTCCGIALITFAVCYAQVGLMETVNENTTIFDLSIVEFYNQYIASCDTLGITTTPPSAADLCTCYNASNYCNSTCTAKGTCTNDYNYSCYYLLEESCDCKDAFYQYQCECDYNFDGTCTIAYTGGNSSVNPVASKEWDSCRKSFITPSNILNYNFYIVIAFGAILLLLNLLQILFKFDCPLFDFVLTITSLIFATVQFIILIVGNNRLPDNYGCISSVIQTLPGCAIRYTSNNAYQMETTALAYLSNAYLNLVSSPLIFFISALPDLLALCACLKGDKSEHWRSLTRCCSRRGYQAF